MQLLTEFFEIQSKVFEFFGYKEDGQAIPLDDARKYYWRLQGEGPGEVQFAETEKELEDQDGQYFVNEIYTQRKWVYRGDGFTMVCVDTHTDGNKFLQVFDNAKERPIASKLACNDLLSVDSLWRYAVSRNRNASIRNPTQCDDFQHLIGKDILLDGVRETVLGVERLTHCPPWREGEIIGLMLDG